MIAPDGSQLGILPTEQALQQAYSMNLDLVEVAPEARPPVCRIMDYGKFRYEQSKKAREAKKKQTVIELKEIKLRPKTEEHDFQFKARHAERFLKEGNKAKITMMFRGREMVRMDRGKALSGAVRGGPEGFRCRGASPEDRGTQHDADPRAETLTGKSSRRR